MLKFKFYKLYTLQKANMNKLDLPKSEYPQRLQVSFLVRGNMRLVTLQFKFAKTYPPHPPKQMNI